VARPAVGSTLVFVFWLIPCQSPGFIPEYLVYAQFAGTLIAAIATALEMRWRCATEEAALRRRMRFLLRLLTAGAAIFLLIWVFFVVYYDREGPAAIIPIGFPGLSCCKSKNPEICIHDELKSYDSAEIAACWGVFPVTSVRLGLAASYWWIAGTSGAWIGLLLLLWREPDWIRPPEVSAPETYDLFVSYTKKDRAFVKRLAKDLRRKGFQIWWDQPEVGAGDSLFDRINTGLSRSRQFAVVLSPDSRSSYWVEREISAALAMEGELLERGVKAKTPFVIPILYKKCEVLPLLKDRLRADFTSSYEDGLRDLLRQLLPPSGPRQSRPS
jgi:hypothetical protein